MKKLVIPAILFVTVLGCNKDAAPRQQVEPRRLILITQAYEYEDLDKNERTRTIVDTVDVSGWEKGRNLLYLPRVYDGFTDVSYGFYYPWQGEDSIYYEYRSCYLWVNGKLSASTWPMLKDLNVEETKDVASIFISYTNQREGVKDSIYIPDSENFQRFPNLSLLDVRLSGGDLEYTERILDSIRVFPSHLMLRMEFEDPRMGDIRELTRLENLRWLWLEYTCPGTESNVGLLQLCHARHLDELCLLLCEDETRITERTIDILRRHLVCEVIISHPLVCTVGLKKKCEPLRDVFLAYLLLFTPHQFYKSSISLWRSGIERGIVYLNY